MNGESEDARMTEGAHLTEEVRRKEGVLENEGTRASGDRGIRTGTAAAVHIHHRAPRNCQAPHLAMIDTNEVANTNTPLAGDTIDCLEYS